MADDDHVNECPVDVVQLGKILLKCRCGRAFLAQVSIKLIIEVFIVTQNFPFAKDVRTGYHRFFPLFLKLDKTTN